MMAIEFGCLYQAIDNRTGLRACNGYRKQKILPSHGNGFRYVLGTDISHRQSAVVTVAL